MRGIGKVLIIAGALLMIPPAYTAFVETFYILRDILDRRGMSPMMASWLIGAVLLLVGGSIVWTIDYIAWKREDKS